MIDISVFGPTVISGGGGRIAAADLGGAKLRQLLEMLALDLGRPLPKDRIAERLWDGRPPASYIATIESYVCVLRRRLGLVGGRRGPLATTSHGYVLDPELVRVDAVQVQDLLRAHDADVPRALDLVSGELLADEPYAAWATEARDSFAELLADRCTHAARQANLRGDFEVAVRLAREATRRSYVSEPAMRELMKGLMGTGCRVQALGVYESLRKDMAEDLGLGPEVETQSLYFRILRGSSEERRPQIGGDEISALLEFLRSALTADLTMIIDRPSMYEVGQLLMARAG